MDGTEPPMETYPFCVYYHLLDIPILIVSTTIHYPFYHPYVAWYRPKWSHSSHGSLATACCTCNGEWLGMVRNGWDGINDDQVLRRVSEMVTLTAQIW